MKKAEMFHRLCHWKRRALIAEQQVKELRAEINQRERAYNRDMHELDNHREAYRRRRDQEIGEMGGGG